MKRIAIPLLFLLAGTFARAEVVVYFHSFAHSSVLQIPTNKVLIIEQIQSNQAELNFKLSYNNIDTGITPGGVGLADITLINPNASPASLFTLDTPLRIPGGWTLQNMETQPVFLMGLVINKTDLYAAVGSEIESILIQGPQAKVLASLDSPRPVVSTVETSADLNTWVVDTQATLAKAGSSGLEATTAADADMKAVRIRSRARDER